MKLHKNRIRLNLKCSKGVQVTHKRDRQVVGGKIMGLRTIYYRNRRVLRGFRTLVVYSTRRRRDTRPRNVFFHVNTSSQNPLLDETRLNVNAKMTAARRTQSFQERGFCRK